MTVGGFADHFDVGLSLQDHPKAGPHQRLVIGEQHPDDHRGDSAMAMPEPSGRVAQPDAVSKRRRASGMTTCVSLGSTRVDTAHRQRRAEVSATRPVIGVRPAPSLVTFRLLNQAEQSRRR
jgi:hypothetical protein